MPVRMIASTRRARGHRDLGVEAFVVWTGQREHDAAPVGGQLVDHRLDGVVEDRLSDIGDECKRSGASGFLQALPR
jgi:hypothetical protein